MYYSYIPSHWRRGGGCCHATYPSAERLYSSHEVLEIYGISTCEERLKLKTAQAKKFWYPHVRVCSHICRVVLSTNSFLVLTNMDPSGECHTKSRSKLRIGTRDWTIGHRRPLVNNIMKCVYCNISKFYLSNLLLITSLSISSSNFHFEYWKKCWRRPKLLKHNNCA